MGRPTPMRKGPTMAINPTQRPPPATALARLAGAMGRFPKSRAMMTGRVIELPIESELKDSYLTYAMSVIVARALPDVRDGLKPSQRRILAAMNDLRLTPARPA